MSREGCERFRELISAHADEQLGRAELQGLESHLRECAGCRRFETEVRQLKGLLRAADAFRPRRAAPAGFAAAVMARVADGSPAGLVAFPERRRPVAAWLGFAAAAAAAVLLFASSWQRLLGGDTPGQRLAGHPAPLVAAVAPAAALADEGSMDTWLRQHASLARDATLLGSAEEVEFASFAPAAAARSEER